MRRWFRCGGGAWAGRYCAGEEASFVSIDKTRRAKERRDMEEAPANSNRRLLFLGAWHNRHDLRPFRRATQAVQGQNRHDPSGPLCPAILVYTLPGTYAPLPVPGYKSLNTYMPYSYGYVATDTIASEERVTPQEHRQSSRSSTTRGRRRAPRASPVLRFRLAVRARCRQCRPVEWQWRRSWRIRTAHRCQ